ncbi:MAG: hypothetical protein Q7J30_01660 [Candidatus Azambacteria bacterium]|nr:hypothetical protein [Candidatus Azambacteria bacterium]
MATKLQARINEIHKRVKEYNKHKNDSYSYHPEEIDAVRKMKFHAVKDIEFLLALIGEEIMVKAKKVLHHDDPPCSARLDNGFCHGCNLTPDMQSTCFYLYCPSCDCRLENLKCPNCKQTFKHLTT